MTGWVNESGDIWPFAGFFLTLLNVTPTLAPLEGVGAASSRRKLPGRIPIQFSKWLWIADVCLNMKQLNIDNNKQSVKLAGKFGSFPAAKAPRTAEFTKSLTSCLLVVFFLWADCHLRSNLHASLLYLTIILSWSILKKKKEEDLRYVLCSSLPPIDSRYWLTSLSRSSQLLSLHTDIVLLKNILGSTACCYAIYTWQCYFWSREFVKFE